MEKSTVYFTDFRCPVGTSQLDKLKKLCIAAGIKDIDMDGKFVAIKMHWSIWIAPILTDLIRLRRDVRLSLEMDFAEPMK